MRDVNTRRTHVWPCTHPHLLCIILFFLHMRKCRQNFKVLVLESFPGRGMISFKSREIPCSVDRRLPSEWLMLRVCSYRRTCSTYRSKTWFIPNALQHHRTLHKTIRSSLRAKKLDDCCLRWFILNQKSSVYSYRFIGVYKRFERFLEKLVGGFGWNGDTLLFFQFKAIEYRFPYLEICNPTIF